MGNTARERQVGRPPLPPEQKQQARTIRLTAELWDKLQRLGGIDWLRKKIQQAREPGG